MSTYLDRIRVVLPHILLYSATILYGLLGAAIFHRLELPFETEHLKRHSVAIAEAQESLIGVRIKNPPRSMVAFASKVGELNLTSARLFNETINEAIDALISVSMDAFSEGIRASDLSAMFVMLATMPMNISALFADEDEAGAGAAVANEGGTGTESTSLLSKIVEAKIRPKWNFHSSLFFTTTLLTSIGYGNLVPISPVGRIFCICYAFLGIPLTLITIADVAKFFADLLIKLPTICQQKSRKNQSANSTPFRKDSGATSPRDCYTEQNATAQRDRRERENSVTQESGGGARRSSRARRMTLSDIEYGEKRAADGTLGRDDDEDDDEQMLSEPTFWTKNFVLFLLFAYMSATAFVFTMIQENWNFLDAFYFCLITLVTIGFGDFCPVEEHHYGGWIAFIFVGLILSTLTVDLVGSATIERIHTLGRGLDLGSLLTLLGKGGPDSARILQQLYAGAYQPSDLKLIPYIDQMANGNNGKHTVAGSKQSPKNNVSGQREVTNEKSKTNIVGEHAQNAAKPSTGASVSILKSRSESNSDSARNYVRLNVAIVATEGLAREDVQVVQTKSNISRQRPSPQLLV